LSIFGSNITTSNINILKSIYNYTSPLTVGESSNNIVYSDDTDGKLKYIKPSNTVLTFSGIDFTYNLSNFFASNNVLSATTSTTLVEKMRLTTPVLPRGTYRVDVSYQVNNPSTARRFLRVASWINDSNSLWLDSAVDCTILGALKSSQISSAYTIFTQSNDTSNVIALQYSSPNANLVGIGAAKIMISTCGIAFH
jgi:hypothetical protein